MAEYKLLLPSMGEGVMEATIITWLYNEGDTVNEDDSVVEIATDKVDSDVPTPVSGKIVKILKQKDEVAKVGEAIAILEVAGEGNADITAEAPAAAQTTSIEPEVENELMQPIAAQTVATDSLSGTDLYLSPLVKSIAQQENITEAELKSIKGSGLEGRITKEDILAYLSNRGNAATTSTTTPVAAKSAPVSAPTSTIPVAAGDEIVPMDRMRKIIAENMVKAKQIAPHVTSFIETDVTNVVKWRNKHKSAFEKREGEKLTFMPIFIKAVVKAIQDFPLINVSVDGDKIIKRKTLILVWLLPFRMVILLFR